MQIKSRIHHLGRSTQGGIIVLVLGILSTLLWIRIPETPLTAHAGAAVHPGTGVALKATLSHPKIVQGGDGTVYLDLTIQTPSAEDELERAASDILIVLDRSGSMGEGNKWDYATRAVHTLLDRLQAGDRVGLITFDNSARVVSRMVPAHGRSLERLHAVVRGLQPGASTNLGHALQIAENMMATESDGEGPGFPRRRRVLLLSDGQANVGIVDPARLGAFSRRLANGGTVVSTIGMGLGFNETLMASLADLGMGSFSYLEHLETLGAILARELQDTRLIYAEGSEIHLDLPTGVELLEASGYPIQVQGRQTVIRTGQLLQGSKKNFMATLRVRNDAVAEYPIGALQLSYRAGGRTYQQRIRPGRLTIACIPRERKPEAVAAVAPEVYRQAWIANNLGSLMRKLSDSVRSGERDEAVRLLDEYRGRLDDADQMLPGVKEEAAAELEQLEERVRDAFEGPDQKVRQNREAKSLLGAGQRKQRTVEKKPR